MKRTRAFSGGFVFLITGIWASLNNARADDLKPVETVRSVNGLCTLELEAAVRCNPFPAAGAGWTLMSPVYVLKKANGIDKDVSTLVGPVIRIGQGDRLQISLKNSLDPAQLPKEDNNPSMDYPHGYGVTNLHTHGLHVSPVGLADNVYVKIMKDETHHFDYQTFPNHPAGTFWYHPHKHGSVALQLTGGMAGALIVEGDMDRLKEIKDATEQIFVLQQLHGTRVDKKTKLLTPQSDDIYDKVKFAHAPADKKPQRSWRFLKGAQQKQVMQKARRSNVADACQQAACKQADTVPSPTTSEWLLVNGQSAPTFCMQPSEVQRWRFIHAGLDEVINLAVVETNTPPANYQTLQEIAVDGLPRGKKIPRNSKLIYPGYRWDALFQAPALKPGETKTLYLINDCAPAEVTLNNNDTDWQLIATIKVSGQQKKMSFPTDEALANCVPADLRGLIRDREIGNRRWNLKFDFPDHDKVTPPTLQINGREYSDKIDRCVRLNTAEEWRIESGTGDNNAAGHPFHIHVNPFQHLVYERVLMLQIHPPPDVPAGLPPLDTKLTDLPLDPPLQVNNKISFNGKGPATQQSFSAQIVVQAGTTLRDFMEKLRAQFQDPKVFPGGNAKSLDGFELVYDFASDRPLIRSLGGSLDALGTPQFMVDGKTDCRLTMEVRRGLADLIWRDTLMAPSGRSEVVRMRFRDWPGETVLHCHIVDHEDQGMMKNILILCPGEEGAKVKGQPRRHSPRSKKEQAFDFRLRDAAGNFHSLSDFGGQSTVLLFFRGSGCLECAKQLHAFNEIHDRLRQTGSALIAISSASEEDLLQAQKALPAGKKLGFLLLADPDHTAFNKYGCLSEKERQAQHGTFIIDAQQTIRWRNVGDEPYMDALSVLETTRQIQVAPGTDAPTVGN
jgi:FtsP/CotA-like multicopper oxidase with cupredoxin domain/peroxiredoxin